MPSPSSPVEGLELPILEGSGKQGQVQEMVAVPHTGFHREAVWAEAFTIRIKSYTTVGGSGDREVQRVQLEDQRRSHPLQK